MCIRDSSGTLQSPSAIGQETWTAAQSKKCWLSKGRVMNILSLTYLTLCFQTNRTFRHKLFPLQPVIHTRRCSDWLWIQNEQHHSETDHEIGVGWLNANASTVHGNRLRSFCSKESTSTFWDEHFLNHCEWREVSLRICGNFVSILTNMW